MWFKLTYWFDPWKQSLSLYGWLSRWYQLLWKYLLWLHKYWWGIGRCSLFDLSNELLLGRSDNWTRSSPRDKCSQFHMSHRVKMLLWQMHFLNDQLQTLMALHSNGIQFAYFLRHLYFEQNHQEDLRYLFLGIFLWLPVYLLVLQKKDVRLEKCYQTQPLQLT